MVVGFTTINLNNIFLTFLKMGFNVFKQQSEFMRYLEHILINMIFLLNQNTVVYLSSKLLLKGYQLPNIIPSLNAAI
jgi:hypothetical protein